MCSHVHYSPDVLLWRRRTASLSLGHLGLRGQMKHPVSSHDAPNFEDSLERLLRDGYVPDNCFPAVQTYSIAEFMDVTYGIKYSLVGWSALILVGFTCFFALITMASLKFLNFQKR